MLVLGLAKSGTSAAKILMENDIKVRINDISKKESKDIDALRDMGADIILGSHPMSVLDDIDLVIKNPGIPYENMIVHEAVKRSTPVVTEIELINYLISNPVIGITGSNGKTTTTMLVNEMLKMSECPVTIAGNIGLVASDVAVNLKTDETMVVELSSFQLQGTIHFKPHIAVLLNIYEAHLDYHKTLENYKRAKFGIFKNQTKDDYLIYNMDDPIVSEGVESVESIHVPFSSVQKIESGAWVDDHYLYFKNEKIIELKTIALVGTHNLENILAAVCASKIQGATNAGIRKVLTSFSGVKHRLQFVENIDGRLFYNDSKATNVLATEKALTSFKQPTILLAGGLDRGNDYEELIPSLKHVKAMIAFGETAPKLIETAKKAGIPVYRKVVDIIEATKLAYQLSEEDDVILLSPSCASWDQFKTFEERGDMFIQAVHRLK